MTTTTTNQNPSTAALEALAPVQVDPNEIGWNEAKELGLDPAPAGLTEDDEAQQG